MVVSEHFLFPFSNLAVFSCHARHFSPDAFLCFSSNVANPFELFPYGNLLDYKRRSFFSLEPVCCHEQKNPVIHLLLRIRIANFLHCV